MKKLKTHKINKMKRFTIFLLLLIASEPAWTQSEARFLRPTNFQKRVTHIILGNNRSYFSLSQNKPSVINVRGPGKLQVMTRGRFPTDTKKSIAYEVIYTIDGGELQKVRFSGIKQSKTASYLNKELGRPGTRQDFEIVLGRGHHTIEFKFQNSLTPVAARYRFTPTRAKKQEWISFSPLLSVEPVHLLANEQVIHYYRFSSKVPLIVEMNGPTELRVMTRIENHYTMKGRIHYRIRVKENGKVRNTYQLSSVRSEVTTYKEDENKELVPGKAREFVIKVPRGKHKYEISLLDKDKSTILGKLLIPKKDVKLMR